MTTTDEDDDQYEEQEYEPEAAHGGPEVWEEIRGQRRARFDYLDSCDRSGIGPDGHSL